MDASRPRTWLLLSLAAVFGVSVATPAPATGRRLPATSAHQPPVGQPAGAAVSATPALLARVAAAARTAAAPRPRPARRAPLRVGAAQPAPLSPHALSVLWSRTLDARPAGCVIPQPFLRALRDIADGVLAPRFRGGAVAVWSGRAGEPPTRVRKWAGSAEYRVPPPPRRPDTYRILVHPSGRIGYTTDHYRRIDEYHPAGGCDCARRRPARAQR